MSISGTSSCDVGQQVPSVNSISTQRLLFSHCSSTTPLPQQSSVIPSGVGQHSPVKLAAIQTGFKLHWAELGSLLGTSDGNADGTIVSEIMDNVGRNEGDVVGSSDDISVGSSVGTIVLVGAEVGVVSTAKVGALVGNSVVGVVVLTWMGARDGAIVAFVAVVVGTIGMISPSKHGDVNSAKCGLSVPFL